MVFRADKKAYVPSAAVDFSFYLLMSLLTVTDFLTLLKLRSETNVSKLRKKKAKF
jgi:hypothetical protein